MTVKLILLFLGLGVILFVASMVSRALYQRLARARGPLSFEQFVTALPENIDREIAKKVHEHFRSWTGVSDFPLEPTDELGQDLGVYGADFEAELAELSAECGIHLPDGSAADVKTVEDVIVLLDKHRSAQEGSSE